MNIQEIDWNKAKYYHTHHITYLGIELAGEGFMVLRESALGLAFYKDLITPYYISDLIKHERAFTITERPDEQVDNTTIVNELLEDMNSSYGVSLKGNAEHLIALGWRKENK